MILVDKTLLLQSVDSNYNNQNIDSNNNGNNLYINASTTTTSYQSHRYHHIGSDNSISSRIGATSQFSLSTHNSNFHDTFTGHFIYLLGYTMSPDFQAQITATPCVLFHYLDPARPKYGTDGLLSSHTVCSTVLDSARCHSGTDEDIIFIRLK